MGSSYGISCSECDYTKDFMVGIGMMYSPGNLADFESELPLIPGLIRSKKAVALIKELLKEKYAIIAPDYGHDIYRCPKCGEFYGRFRLQLVYAGGSYEVEYKCSKCRVVLKPVDYEVSNEDGWGEKAINLKKYPCPKCGKHSLYEGGSEFVCWD